MTLRLLYLAVISSLLVISTKAADNKIPAGQLNAVNASGVSLGSCPLKHTSIEAELSGTVARVSVTQQFHNPFPEKIEAVYVFPLHQDSAVDDMEMKIGERVIKGVIKEREEAQKIYTEAKNKGHVASLLDQERPNIFTQSVANIEPGQQVTITIRYSQTLTWKDGRYEFDVPTVVGPRYIPDAHTNEIPDAERITPPIAAEGYRAGHGLSVTVKIHAGIPIEEIKCDTHEITIEHPQDEKSHALIRLKEGTTLPDRDFALSYRTASEIITDSVLTHTDERGKFFTIVLQPPARVKPEQVVPRELIFVLDTSGSMSGFPLETSKALMRKAINNLRPDDRFNLITFAGSTETMAPKPLDNTPTNRQRALRFIDTLKGSGGTEMMKAIDTALGGDIDPKKVRIVCFLTDGYVGNDKEIVAAVKKHARTTRVFSFGIGSSVNRYLLSSMAREGRGDAQFVLSHGTAEAAATRFYEGIDAPVLTDLALDFGGLAVEEIYPTQPSDLFASQPVVIKGRYTKAGASVVRLTGSNAAGAYQRELTITLPEENAENAVLASQWARAKVDQLMTQDVEAIQSGERNPLLNKEIIALGTTYSLLTPFTSFVAVETEHTTEGGQPRTISVPVEMPHGVSHLGIYGDAADFGGGWGSGMGGSGGGFSGIPSSMSKRCTKVDRLERLKATGGTPACEDAVVKSLDWIMQHQKPDGSWYETNRAAATGLSLLAYLGHCETPLSERYGESVLKATTFLIGQSTANKGLLIDDPNDPLSLHEHAIATMALAEAYILNNQLQIHIPGHEEAVRLAAKHILDSALKTGGWSVSKDSKSADTTLTCLNLQALKVCFLTNILSPQLKSHVKKALAVLKARKDQPGTLALVYHQWAEGDTPAARAAHEAINKRKDFRWTPAQTDLWTLYFDTQALFLRGGQTWTDFNASLLPELLKAQAPDGSFTDPGEPTTSPSAPLSNLLNGKSAKHFQTCLSTLTLEVYYRSTPATQKTTER